MRVSGVDRALAALACLAGLLGVALSAAAAHVPGADSLKTAAQFLLFHAPAILALVGLGTAGFARSNLARVAAGLLVLGLILFCGDLSARTWLQQPLFPMAAPSGGFALMGGWLAGILCAWVPARRG
ncbi:MULTISPECIES: DUF423 domain-containing protein [Methylobacterium]|uniref:DUF423 domain-containing protein n=1 Tax=Methylobacterium longum TaxID=767694 RepID=A0ABT8APS3_9HYPH|nr:MULTISPECIES: DUF423 domain-containing protein [Methylobacterium]MCJ2097286.1 DUF423 domain-containing protein [Methylobacterium sp. E-046]MDN3571851.1 DUF423 domain-containing protein [Methylobacterium longum]GJE14494.1 hypothetical protein FOHLNKBM_5569 [Methylobacterium longum]